MRAAARYIAIAGLLLGLGPSNAPAQSPSEDGWNPFKWLEPCATPQAVRAAGGSRQSGADAAGRRAQPAGREQRSCAGHGPRHIGPAARSLARSGDGGHRAAAGRARSAAAISGLAPVVAAHAVVVGVAASGRAECRSLHGPAPGGALSIGPARRHGGSRKGCCAGPPRPGRSGSQGYRPRCARGGVRNDQVACSARRGFARTPQG